MLQEELEQTMADVVEAVLFVRPGTDATTFGGGGHRRFRLQRPEALMAGDRPCHKSERERDQGPRGYRGGRVVVLLQPPHGHRVEALWKESLRERARSLRARRLELKILLRVLSGRSSLSSGSTAESDRAGGEPLRKDGTDLVVASKVERRSGDVPPTRRGGEVLRRDEERSRSRSSSSKERDASWPGVRLLRLAGHAFAAAAASQGGEAA